MKSLFLIEIVIAFLLAGGLLAAGTDQERHSQSKAKTRATSPAPGSESEGEKRFRANCGRCHNPPSEISPREARAVLRHMRVRAILSAEDEKLILKYLAP